MPLIYKDRVTPHSSWTITPLLGFLLLAFCVEPAAPATHKDKYLLYIGTYTEEGSKSKGVYVYRFDPDTTQLTSAGLAAETTNPSFLAVHPNHRFLYAVNEVGNYKGQKSGKSAPSRSIGQPAN